MVSTYLAAAIYSVAFIALAVNLTDAGHGTTIFLAPLTPLGVPWLVLLAAFALLPHIEATFAKFAFLGLMAIHYVVSFILVLYMWEDALPGTIRMWDRAPVWVVVTVLVYVIGQLYIWVRFVFEARKHGIDIPRK